MPTVKIQDSDGKEKALIGNAVLGISTNGKEYVANIVAVEPSGVFYVVSAALAYFKNTFADEFAIALRKYQPKKVVICAAIIADNGKVFRGHRHSDCIKTILAAGLKPGEQGFIDSTNQFVTREQGRVIQDAAGIPSANPEGYMGNTLFSEDLY